MKFWLLYVYIYICRNIPLLHIYKRTYVIYIVFFVCPRGTFNVSIIWNDYMLCVCVCFVLPPDSSTKSLDVLPNWIDKITHFYRKYAPGIPIVTHFPFPPPPVALLLGSIDLIQYNYDYSSSYNSNKKHFEGILFNDTLQNIEAICAILCFFKVCSNPLAKFTTHFHWICYVLKLSSLLHCYHHEDLNFDDNFWF